MVWSSQFLTETDDHLFVDDDDTIKTPVSPDSVCFQTTSLTPMIGHPGAAARAASGTLSSDQSAAAKSLSTNGSDSTWKASSLLGSDGIPWWEDQETSQIPGHGSGLTPSVYSATSAFSNSMMTSSFKLTSSFNNNFHQRSTTNAAAAPTADSIHADLMVFVESMRGDTVQFHPTSAAGTRRSRSAGNQSSSDLCVSSSHQTGRHHHQESTTAPPRRRRSLSGDMALGIGPSISWPSRSAGNQSSSDLYVSSSHQTGRHHHQESTTAPHRRRRSLSGDMALGKGPATSWPVHDSASASRFNNSGGSSAQVESTRGRPTRQDSLKRQRRRSLSNSRLVPSESSHGSGGSGNEQRHSDHKLSTSGLSSGQRREIIWNTRRRCSLSGTRVMAESCDNNNTSDEHERGRQQRKGHRQQQEERVGRSSQPESSAARRRRSLSSGRVVPSSSSQGRSRSSRALVDADASECESSFCGEEERQPKSQNSKRSSSRRPSLTLDARRQRKSSQPRSRSSRSLYGGDDEADSEPCVYGDDDDDDSQMHRRSSRPEGREAPTSRQRHRSRSTHRRLDADRSQQDSDEMHSSSQRHQHRRSKSGRDLMATSSPHRHHASDDNGGARSSRERAREGGGGQRRHRSRSRHTMRSAVAHEDDDDVEHHPAESKMAVKNFIKGLLKDAPSVHNRQHQLTDESSVRPSRPRQSTSTSSSHQQQPAERRQSCGGLESRSSHRRHPTSSREGRRPSGKHTS